MIERALNHLKLRYLSYFSKTEGKVDSTEVQLEKALSWFRQSLLKTGGSSSKYSMLYDTFFPAYPETTGYWLNTLFFAQQHFPEIYNKVFGSRPVIHELKDWLLSIQRLDGTFPGSYGDYMNQPPRVFNNGQIILGLLRYYEHFKDEKVMDAITASADWLVKVQDADGAWRQFTVYQLSSNTRTAHALMKLSKATGNPKYNAVAIRNIEFAIKCQQPNGYIAENGFESEGTPFTHTIGYAIKGILECALVTGNQDWMDAVERAVEPLINMIKPSGFLPGQIDDQFRSASDYCCLTGNSQLSVITFRLYRATGNEEYKRAGNLLINYVRHKQIKSDMLSISGGIAGSWPISGNYCPYEIPNWSVKFFVDALIAQYLNKVKDFSE